MSAAPVLESVRLSLEKQYFVHIVSKSALELLRAWLLAETT